MTATQSLYRPAVRTTMEAAAERHREAREGFRISALRPFADHLEELGYPVAWQTIQRYELLQTRIPADYTLILARATRTSPTWLLAGEGERDW
jgi:deoxyribodipyrimidine photolyase-like uncharacterized protein